METFYETEWVKEMANVSICEFKEVYSKEYNISYIQDNAANMNFDFTSLHDESSDSVVDLYSFYKKFKRLKRESRSNSKEMDNWRQEIDVYCNEGTTQADTDILKW